jgi:diketogulonate reductase-like aldo/keto reductase
VKSISAKYKITPEQVLFAFLHAANVTPLTGTSSANHMEQDLFSVTGSSVLMDSRDIRDIQSLFVV